MELFVQQLVNAISLGGIYALLALGLAIVFSIMGMVNFAHGEIMTLGGYAMWFVAMQVGAPLPVILLAALVVSMTAALLMERIAFRPVRGASATTMLITSFAVSVMLQVVFQNVISPRPKGVPRSHRADRAGGLSQVVHQSYRYGDRTLGRSAR
jgi:branched-chain amino acid transport system permease protein